MRHEKKHWQNTYCIKVENCHYFWNETWPSLWHYLIFVKFGRRWNLKLTLYNKKLPPGNDLPYKKSELTQEIQWLKRNFHQLCQDHTDIS